VPGLIKTNVILIAHIIAIAHPFTLLLLLLKLPRLKHLRQKKLPRLNNSDFSKTL
jgi:hypothetical protein